MMKYFKRLALIATFPLALASSASANPTTQLDNWLERLGVALIAQQLGIDADMVYGNLDWGRSVYNVTPTYVIAQRTQRDPDDVWALRRQGLGWGQIAKRMGMHPGTFNKLRKSGAFDSNSLWNTWINRRYGLTNNQIRHLRSLGFGWDEIAGIAHIHYRSGAPLQSIINTWNSERRWDRVRTVYRVTDDWGPGKWKSTSWTRGTWKGTSPPKVKSNNKGGRDVWEQKQTMKKAKPSTMKIAKKDMYGKGRDVKKSTMTKGNSGKGKQVTKVKGKSGAAKGGKGIGKGKGG